MVGILLKFKPPRENSNDLRQSPGFALKCRRGLECRGVAASELLTEHAVPRRVQGPLIYIFREVNGNP